MIVFLNPGAGGGTAARRWGRLRARLEDGPLRGGYDLVTDRDELRRRLAAGHDGASRGRLVVAAGGDGTVNLVAALLMSLPEAERRSWVLGAIGLGSSNDFHRPAAERARLPPMRVDLASARAQPIGRVTYVDAAGTLQEACFLMNASVGVVALGNHLFNDGGAAGRFLKRRWTAAAIGYAAMRALLGGRDVEARIAADGESWVGEVTNLHVLLSPYVSGGLRYDVEVPRERAFSMALCRHLGRMARVRTMAALAGGHFEGRRGTLLRTARCVEIEPSALVPLETDGEVFLARTIRCEHVAGGLNVCA